MNTNRSPLRKQAALLLGSALLAVLAVKVAAQTSYNTGSLGVAGDGEHTFGVVLDQPGAVTGGIDHAVYDGNGTAVGWDLTSGTYTFNQWCHVVAVWDGNSAELYVNGALADETNEPRRSGEYVSSLEAIFSMGALFNGGSPTSGLVDEIAWYPTALDAGKIAAHVAAASSPEAGAYSALVKGDGTVLYPQQNPPEISIWLDGANPVVEFTGILSASTGLAAWEDLDVSSPYAIPMPRPAELFFRVRR